MMLSIGIFAIKLHQPALSLQGLFQSLNDWLCTDTAGHGVSSQQDDSLGIQASLGSQLGASSHRHLVYLVPEAVNTTPGRGQTSFNWPNTLKCLI